MSIPSPTKEQQTILDNQARIRLVRAVPGSGKTWLVANLIKKELGHWHSNHCGIAALSFTRVGGDEIRKSIGYDLHHPHFVGTIDAFLFRFIVRPFLSKVLQTLKIPRLIPTEWEPNRWQSGPGHTKFTVRTIVGGTHRSFNLFNVCFLGEKDGQTIITCKQHPWDPPDPLDPQVTGILLKQKNKLWETHGWLTHSDASFLTSKILQDPAHGATVRAEVLRRFPLVIIDELQDTGWFLGQCIMQLLAEPFSRGVLVGDPSQAIYEFSGARPDLFDRFNQLSGTQQLTLTQTQRCSLAVCKVAEHLSSPTQHISPATNRAGRAFLLWYTNFEADIRRLYVAIVKRSGSGLVKMVARHTKTIEKLTYRGSTELLKLGSTPLNHLHQAVNNFRRRRQVSALAGTQAALAHTLFGYEGITQDELDSIGISTAAWRQLAVEVLFEANSEKVGETFESWWNRISAFIQTQLTSITASSTPPKAIRRPSVNERCKARKEYLIETASNSTQEQRVAVQTVHAVKGETHDLTVLVCPDNGQKSRCPSEIWWEDGEERRIAFVAVTRTRGDLVVCVSKPSFNRLKENRRLFVASFECMPINDFIGNTCKPTD